MHKGQTIFLLLLAAAMVCILAACSGGVSPALTYGAEGSDDSLLVVQRGDSYGYADTTGKVVIKPQYQGARPFSEGLAAVKRGGKYGYIDKTGKTALPFKYDEALDFHNGKAFVGIGYIEEHSTVKGFKYKIPKYRIINRDGTLLKETDYKYVGSYSDGLMAVARCNSNELMYLDKNCNEVKLPGEGNLDRFSDEIAVVYGDSGEYSFIDRYGNKVGQDYNIAYDFSEGLAAVCIEGEFGYINKSGIFAIAPQYLDAGPFGEGLACVVTKDGTFKIIDTSGKEIFAGKDTKHGVDSYGKFSEGLCSVIRREGETSLYGFIDKTGKLVIDCSYNEVTPFKNGIAEMLLDGKIGYIDKTGKYIWEPK